VKCRDELIQLYHDRELDAARRKQVEAHLAECARCRAKLAELEAIDSLLADGEAERVPDPGKHYWHGFTHRVTRKLTAHPLLRPRPRRKPGRLRLLPYLSAGVAVLLALAITIPMLKRIPVRYKEEELQALKQVPEQPAGGVVRTEKTEERKEEADLVLMETAPPASTEDIISPETPAEEAPLKILGGRTTDEELTAPSEKEETAKTRRETATSTDKRLKASGGSAGAVKSVYEASGGKNISSEGAWSFDRQFVPRAGVPQPGTLRVVIDSTGQLLKVSIYRSCGDPKADSTALQLYVQTWQGRVFRQRQAAILVPFSQD